MENLPITNYSGAAVGYTGYVGPVDYIGYTMGCHYYSKSKEGDVLAGYKVGETITIYNHKTNKEHKYLVKRKHPWFLAIKKKGWFTFTRIIYRNNISKVGHLLIEK